MNRVDLYALVWAKPVTHVARQFGVSDVAIHKICIKHGIPTPPLGYWARLKHGKKVVQTPLPPLTAGQSDHIDLRMRAKPDLLPEVVKAIQLAEQGKDGLGDQLLVPTERPAKLHPMAAATEKALRKAKLDDEGFVACGGVGKVDVKVGPASIDRVTLLIHAFLNAATEKGYQLSAEAEARIVVDEQPLAVRIYETKDKSAHQPTPADLKRQATEDQWRSKYSADYKSARKVYPTWDYSPSGHLVLEISDPNQVRWRADPIVGRWRDRSIKRLEDYLGDAVLALKIGGAVARHQRAKEAEEARAAKEAEDRRREQVRQQRLFEQVTAFLMKKADKHAELIKLETLAAHLVQTSGGATLDKYSDLNRAIEFVLVNLRNQLTADSISQEISQSRMLEVEHWW